MNGASRSEGAPPEEIVVAYHERTKHHFRRYARALGYLDWATQPDPFRRFAGAPLVALPLPPVGDPLLYADVYAPGAVPPRPLDLASLSRFFRYSLSLTAWKSYRGTAWSLRANPSSGNLHPTEGYAILPAIDGLADAPGVHHYAPHEHGLERRAAIDRARFAETTTPLPPGAFFVGLTSIHWREAWKYGERAFRYCQHDAGHALAAMRIAAAALGWRLDLLDAADRDIASALGLDRDEDFDGAEREEAELLALVRPATAAAPPIDIAERVASLGRGAEWCGRANPLSASHVADWPVVDEVAGATRRTSARVLREDLAGLPARDALAIDEPSDGGLTAEKVILGRRSAVALDGSTSIDRATFYRMLARVVPACDDASMPFDALGWRPRIHLALFVHRVTGVPSGLYALARDPAKEEALRTIFRGNFLWRRPAGCPSALPLYLLEEGDCRELAAAVSCGQEIAGDGAFSLGMIADYMDSLASLGAPFYRNLFWEAGMVGQVLYLEAEEAGIRATGIGCYFDDGVHEVFGITTREWQSFYHFTVGGPVEDTRLTTRPGYEAR